MNVRLAFIDNGDYLANGENRGDQEHAAGHLLEVDLPGGDRTVDGRSQSRARQHDVDERQPVRATHDAGRLDDSKERRRGSFGNGVSNRLRKKRRASRDLRRILAARSAPETRHALGGVRLKGVFGSSLFLRGVGCDAKGNKRDVALLALHGAGGADKKGSSALKNFEFGYASRVIP